MFVEVRPHSVAQIGLELTTFPPPSPKHWDYKCSLPHLLPKAKHSTGADATIRLNKVQTPNPGFTSYKPHHNSQTGAQMLVSTMDNSFLRGGKDMNTSNHAFHKKAIVCVPLNEPCYNLNVSLPKSRCRRWDSNKAAGRRRAQPHEWESIPWLEKGFTQHCLHLTFQLLPSTVSLPS